VLEAACWAHVRRKFFDATAGPAAIAAARIAELYAVEARIRGTLPTSAAGSAPPKPSQRSRP
jgi:hypothetical protein